MNLLEKIWKKMAVIVNQNQVVTQNQEVTQIQNQNPHHPHPLQKKIKKKKKKIKLFNLIFYFLRFFLQKQILLTIKSFF